MKRNRKYHLTAMILGAALVMFAGAAAAQNRGGGDRDRDNRGRHEERSDYRFRSEDRGHFRGYYQGNIRQWQQRPERRHHIRAGEQLPSDYRSRLRSMPVSYYRSMPPPPRGYRFGYYDGYVVAYNPTTRIVADVLDLVDAAVRH